MNFVNTYVLDIVDDMVSSNVLAANYRVIYAGYIRVAKMMIKNEFVLAVLA